MVPKLKNIEEAGNGRILACTLGSVVFVRDSRSHRLQNQEIVKACEIPRKLLLFLDYSL
jgi:hypothetical protein